MLRGLEYARSLSTAFLIEERYKKSPIKQMHKKYQLKKSKMEI